MRDCTYLIFEGAYLPPWHPGMEPYHYPDWVTLLDDWETQRIAAQKVQ